MSRQTEFDKLCPMFIERWSPRSFTGEHIPEEDIFTLFEAARWSPSCFNEQPWHFKYATSCNERERTLSTLVPDNREWASSAPLLLIIFSRKRFERNKKNNRWSEFDTGAAWMSLNLQAHKMGLSCHAMGGFDRDMAYKVTGMDREEFTPICVVAIGKMDTPDKLPQIFRDKEVPSERNPLSTIVSKV